MPERVRTYLTVIEIATIPATAATWLAREPPDIIDARLGAVSSDLADDMGRRGPNPDVESSIETNRVV